MTLRVIVVDDTLTSRQLLTHIVNSSGDMEVVGEGNNGEQAVKLAHEHEADVLLMDIIMPRMDGLEATRHIMQQAPMPIVLITASMTSNETDIAFQAMKAGALTVLQKPEGLNPADVSHIRTTLRAMAGVQVIHHYDRQVKKAKPQIVIPDKADPQIVAIASSTGGPAALSAILSQLPADFPLPIMVVQHISPDFVNSLAEWLGTTTRLKVRVPEQGEHPKAGEVYIAPGDAHMSIQPDTRVAYDREPGTWRYMPSCDVLLHSIARSYGSRAVGIVLTGMGDDGADGLREMYERGALTIAQDEASSVVYGMPCAAAERGGVGMVLSPDDIAAALNKIVKQGEYP